MGQGPHYRLDGPLWIGASHALHSTCPTASDQSADLSVCPGTLLASGPPHRRQIYRTKHSLYGPGHNNPLPVGRLPGPHRTASAGAAQQLYATGTTILLHLLR